MNQESSARKLGIGSAAFMVFASMIGTGVFTSLGFQVGLPFSSFDLLLLWGIGGALALCGALAYGELALRMPRSGGECRFLDEIYGPLAGFLAGWISVIAGFSASLAACAFALASYAGPLIAAALGETHGGSIHKQIEAAATGAVLYPQLALATAGLTIVGLTWVHRARVEHAMRFQNVFVFLKLGLVIAFLAAAFSAPALVPVSFYPTNSVWSALRNPGFAVALVFVTFSYSGWNAAVYIADDVRKPERTLPRALLLATIVVVALYVLLNAAFLRSAPRDSFVGRPDVAFVVAERLFGAAGAVAVAAAISIGLISSVSSLIWAGGSVVETLAAQRAGFSWLAKRNANDRPSRAFAVISAIALAMLVTSSFDSVIKLIGVLLAGCASVAVLGVFILDRRAASMGGRRSPLYIKAASAVFLVANAWILAFLTRQEPASVGAAALTLVSGTLVYYAPGYFAKWRTRRSETLPAEPAIAEQLN